MNCIRIVGLFVIALTLGACGGGETSDPSAPPVGGTPTPAPTPPPTPPPAPPATVAVTARGTALGPIEEMSVTAAGGKLVSSDGRLTVDAPAGALPNSQKITLQATSNESPGGAGLAYRLLPEGQTFAAPVKLTFNYGKADINGSAPAALKIAYQDKEGRWNAIKNFALDEAAKTVTVATTHFSDWSMLKGWQLRPPSATVGAGKAVDLEVVTCANKGTGSDELAELTYTCVPDPEFFTVEDWAVNGTNGGTVALGQVATSQPGTARYSAPNSAPPNNPVSVSANAKEKSGKKTLLIASIWVEAFPPLSGTITSTQVVLLGTGGTTVFTTSANVTFKYEVTEQMYRITSGNVVSRHDRVVPGAGGCEYHVRFAGAIGAQDGAIVINGDDGRYTADGKTLAAHTGTTTCTSDGRVEPLTIENAVAHWWPAPPAPHPLVPIPGAMELRLKPDGRLEELINWTPGAGGATTTVQWSLRPDS